MELSDLPPEFTTPPENLRPGPRESDFYMETTGYSAGNAKVTSWIGRNVAGVTVGILQLRAILPMVPGHIANATTFDFPLLYRETLVPNPYTIMALDPDEDQAFLDECVKACNWLELQGVRAIVGNCGFFGTFQKAIGERIDTPFFSSSLVQLPTVLTVLPSSKKVGVVTANGPVLQEGPAIENCGVSPEDKKNRVVIEGCQGPEFTKVLGQTGEPFDVQKLEEEIVAGAMRIIEREENIGSILLECTELAPAAYAVQNAVRMPVYDYSTLIRFAHDASRARQYHGFK